MELYRNLSFHNYVTGLLLHSPVPSSSHHLLFLLALLIHLLLLLLCPFLLLPPLVFQHLLVEGARWRLVVLTQEALDVVRQFVNHHLRGQASGLKSSQCVIQLHLH